MIAGTQGVPEPWSLHLLGLWSQPPPQFSVSEACAGAHPALSLALLCRGGAELLFDGVKKHQVTLPGQEEPCEYGLLNPSLGATGQELLHRVAQPRSSENGWNFPGQWGGRKRDHQVVPASSPQSASFVGRRWPSLVLTSAGSVFRQFVLVWFFLAAPRSLWDLSSPTSD